MRVLLVGAGYMAKEYAKVLSDMHIEFDVVTRSEATAKAFFEETGKEAYFGGLGEMEEKPGLYDAAINAVSAKELYNTSKMLMNMGVSRILAEKPLCHTFEEAESLVNMANETNAEVYVAYNRRFYASVDKAIDIIKEDGGLNALFFEFTEWLRLYDFDNPSMVSRDCLLVSNSSHVIDLAFFFAGMPRDYHFFSNGNDGNNEVFVGSGITEKGVYFSYLTAWESPGRWGIELLTPKHRLYLKPMETLQIQEMNSVNIQPVEIDDEIDKKYKPGLYRQVESFLECKDDGKKKGIDDQLSSIKLYHKIAKGI